MNRRDAGARKGDTRARASGTLRRLEIIAATLRVMQREGLRAVSHRAVASEAGVPLAATTYYFRDLEELITESFLHWSAAGRGVVSAVLERVLEELRSTRAAGLQPEAQVLRLAELVAGYIEDQVGAHRGDRVLEFAFLHEAIRLPRLRAVVRRQQQELLGMLERFHLELGSAHPAIDARISHSVLLGLEKGALLTGSVDGGEVRVVLARYLRSVMTPGD
jgi:DNA-binding transcriptional regulator YbjK